MKKSTISETEKAMSHQPALLELDWRERMSKAVRKAARGAKSVTFVGTGTSYHCALWAHWLCATRSAGKFRSRAMTAWDFLAENQPASLERSDLVVVISHRGCQGLTKAVLDRVGARRILIASQGSPAGSHPHVYTSEPETSNAHTMSLFGAIGATSEIAGLVLGAKGKSLARERTQAGALLRALAGQNPPATLLSPDSGLHIVGGGPFHAVAMEIGLKAREMAYIAAHHYNTEELLHGPMTSVEDRDTVLLLSPAKSGGSPLLKLLYGERTKACRQAAEAVGALVVEPRWDKRTQAKLARLDPCWQALLSLYWGQLLCLATAKRRNINPDSNRREDARYDEAYRLSALRPNML